MTTEIESLQQQLEQALMERDVAQRQLVEQAALVEKLKQIIKAAPHTFSCEACLEPLPAPWCHCWKSYQEVRDILTQPPTTGFAEKVLRCSSG